MINALVMSLFFYVFTFASNNLAELEKGIANSENTFKPHLKTGTEKKITWARSDHPEKTKLSIVYIHGFSASRGELSPVPEILAQKLNSNLFMTRLTGHGLNSESFSRAKKEDWINDTKEALDVGLKIGQEVIFIGFSTGASLILKTVLKNQDGISALILLSPNFRVKNQFSDLLLLPYIGTVLCQWFFGEIRSWKPVNEKQAHFWTTTYPSIIIPEVLSLARDVRSSSLEKIKTPTLIAYTQNDEVIDTKEILTQYKRLSSSKNQLLEFHQAKDHVLAGDIIAPKNNNALINKLLSFVQSLEIL